MARLTQWLAILFPVVFTILSMSFAITATTSKDWASQNHFNASDPLQVQTNWSKPIFTLYRSPFIFCPDGINCYHYRPYGIKKTSCELPFALKTDDAPNLGDERQCQQIHYAGNLAIASTTFMGISFLLTLALTLASFLLVNSASTSSSTESSEATAEESHKSHSRHHHSAVTPALPRSILGPLAPYLTLLSVFLLLSGSLMYFIAQFYGIEALVQSAPDNGDYASAGYVGGGTGNTNHQPWIQGKAVSIYSTLAWVFGVLGAGASLSAWRLPVWERVL